MSPSIDVIVFTYNHEEFIEDALRSVVMQIVDAEVTIRVHDDCSTDGTLSRVQSFAEETHVPIVVTTPKENRYASGSSFRWDFIKSSVSDYVAFLDGDDYWTDPSKLQLQIEAFDKFPESSLSSHLFSAVGETGVRRPQYPPKRFRQAEMPSWFLSDHNFIGTSTVMVRANSIPDTLPPGYDYCRGVDDYPLWVAFSLGKKINFIDRDMSAYRIHNDQHFRAQNRRTKQNQLLGALVYIAGFVPHEERRHWLEQIKRVAVSESLVSIGWRLFSREVRRRLVSISFRG